MKTRFFAALLALCMVLSLIPAVSAEEPVTTWDIEDGVLTVCGSGDMFADGEPRPDGWPTGEGITSIIISEGITSVGDFAFKGFYDVTTVLLPISLEEIGYAAFQDCYVLDDVIMPHDLMVSKDAFLNTKWLENLTDENGFAIHSGVLLSYTGEETTLTVPEGVVSIAGDFSDTQFEEVILPESVKILSDYAFYMQKALSRINFPSGLTYVGGYAFEQCKALTVAELPESVQYVGEGVFQNCFALTTSSIPADTVYVGGSVFQGCSELTKVTLGEGITTIGDDFFNGCYKLPSIELPNSVTTIGEKAFGKCYDLTELNIPENVTSIGYEAFWYCWKLTSLTLPDGLKTLGEFAFNDCTSLEELNIPDALESLSYYAFADTPWMKNQFDDNGYAIVNGWLLACNGPETTIVVPDSVDHIADYAFYQHRNRENVVSVTLPEKLDYLGHGAFCELSSLVSVTLPEGITFIGDSCFLDCFSLVSIDIPEGVTEINRYAFGMCGSLASVTLPDSLESIDSNAFYNCASLTSVELPESLTTIKDYAFYGCAMTSVTIPASVTEIGDYAFGYMESPYYENEAISDFTVQGYSGTEADSYANIHGFRFVNLDGDQPPVIDPDLPEGSGWNAQYARFIIQDMENSADFEEEMVSYQLHYIDDDNIPELWIDYGIMASGCRLLSAKKAGITEKLMQDGTLFYVERGDVFYYSGGRQGYYYDTVYRLSSGFSFIAEGLCYVPFDDAGSPNFDQMQYFWNDDPVTEDAYYNMLWNYVDPVIGKSTISQDNTVYTYEEILDYLRSLDVSDDEPIFDDVPVGEWFETPVAWAVANNITQGTGAGKFSPEDDCTRAQVVTFLWRAAGEPMPESTVNPFTDVSSSDWFYNAVLWAVENNITVGVGGGKFGTEQTCTRAQVATFLWRTAGEPQHHVVDDPFIDLAEDWYVDPVLWAFENQITQGDGAANTFNPAGECTRAQIVTFLYRYMG